MKSLIVTTQYVNNYGAVLQAVGFHKFLEGMSHGAHFFLRQTASDDRVFEPLFPLGKRSVAAAYYDAMRLLNFPKIKRRLARFSEFRETYLPMVSAEEGQQECGLYITGGDQMFNRSCLNRPVNLLQFGDSAAKRISYSTSMGSAVFSDEEWQRLGNALQRYDAVSLREAGSAEVVASHVTVPVRTDIDCSFLVDKDVWNSVAKYDQSSFPERYILVYELMTHPDLEKTLAMVQKQYGLPIVKIADKPRYKGRYDTLVLDAGPAEFLGLFQHAACVVTTSFHGTCFSIINRKPFISLVQNNEKRITAMLEEFGLSGCYYRRVPEGFLLKMPDFKMAEEKIAAGRESATRFLRPYFAD